jgi:endonuclease YncB( thermonuclease family)
MRFVLFLFAALLLAPVTPGSAEQLFGRVRIVDGDTLEIGSDRIRLHGIDAPETGQDCVDGAGRSYRCGVVAASILSGLVGTGPVTRAGSERDRDGRLIAVCHKAGKDINAEMVRLGWARAFLHYSQDYVALESDAKTSRNGLWAGNFEAPWDFRRAKWKFAVLGAPVPGCPIKGNISANGRIYHAPYSRWYDRTAINLSKGERWFCSEREALDAGWRAPNS